jgi:hypothetical protein
VVVPLRPITFLEVSMAFTKVNNSGLFLRRDTAHNVAFPNSPIIIDPPVQSVLKYTDSFNGVPNPGYKHQIRTLQSATTPASGIRWFVDSMPILSATLEVAFHTDHNNYRFYSFLGQPIELLPSTLDRQTVDTNSLNHVTALVNSRFLDRCKSVISSFQSGQDIIEVKQTIESIIHPLASLRKHVETYFLNLKKVKGRYQKIRDPRGRARSLSKALSDTYLEWTFGWNPLASDIAQGIVDLGRTRFNATPVHATAKIRYFGASSTSNLGVSPFAAISCNSLVTGDYEIRLKGMVDAYYNKQPPSLLQELQLLPEDFAPTAWNVLPYSFVIDYFLNIGDIINAYSFPSAALSWCNRTQRDTTRITKGFFQNRETIVTQFPPSSWDWLNREFSGANFDVSAVSFVRDSIRAQDLIPPLVFEIPGVTQKPWLNMAALITGSKKLVCPFF